MTPSDPVDARPMLAWSRVLASIREMDNVSFSDESTYEYAPHMGSGELATTDQGDQGRANSLTRLYSLVS